MIEKRSNSDEKAVSSFDEVSELLEGSENLNDSQRRTRQLRPSIISSPWRVSSGASYRAIDFPSSLHNNFGSNLRNFPTATAGLLYKSDGRFYPNNNFKTSDEFSPVISTYSGSNKNKYYTSYLEDSDDRVHEASKKFKQSSKIPGRSSTLFPVLFSLDSFDQKVKASTSRPHEENYSYFHIGKSESEKKPDNFKTHAFPVTNLPSTTHRNPFVPLNSVGGFFNNNNHNNNFLALKPVSKHVTPAPIYEGSKSASSYDSRYTTASPIKATPSSHYASNPFLNNLAFSQKPVKYVHESTTENIVQITTKKPTYFTQYPIVTSTPKYVPAYTTPNQLFDFDKFVAGIREAQRIQNSQKHEGISNLKSHNTTHGFNNHYRPEQVFPKPHSTTTASPDEFYYDYEDDVEAPIVDTDLIKLKNQSGKLPAQSFNHPKPAVVSNEASDNDDFYYDDDEDDDDYEEFRPPPVNKPKYTPMTETMAPRPMNVTTLRPYYVSGQTFSTPPPTQSTTSIVPSIIKFPDDVFQAIRSFTSPAPNLINSQKVKPNKHNDIIKSTTSSTTTERSTKRPKIKTSTKSYDTQQTTPKKIRLTTRKRTYTIRPNRGNMKFKVSTKRPDLTRLEIDEKFPNR